MTGDEGYSAPGRPATHPYAVAYRGEYETLWDGTAVAVRLHARALAATGLPVLLRSFSHTVIDEYGVPGPVHLVGVPDAVREEIGALNDTSAAALCPLIQHLVVRSGEHLRQSILPTSQRGGVDDVERALAVRDHIYARTIVYSVWERDSIDPEIVRHLSRVAQCWVPCQHNARLLIASGVPSDRVRVVPHPYSPDDNIWVLRRRPAAMHDGWRNFYAIGRWEPRKAHDELIGAFLSEFQATEPVRLTVKYTGGDWKDYPSASRALARWGAVERVRQNGWTPERIADRVRLVDTRVPRSGIVRLHFQNNIYVGATHGEAWNLPAFDAKLAGNRLVHVPYGGTADFAGDQDVAVPYELGPAHSSYGWGTSVKWATFTQGALQAALRQAAAPRTHQGDALDRFELTAVGRTMARCVLEVASVQPDAERYLRAQLRDEL